MSSTPADIVREAAEKDSKAAVETWGPEAFARRIRTKIHNFGAPLPPWEDKGVRPTPAARGIPKSINVILLGPTGSGKSSLIYTWWRALSGSVTGKEEFLAENVHDSFLQRLRVGWNAKDGQENRRRAQPATSSSPPPSSSSSPSRTGNHSLAGGGEAGSGLRGRESMMSAAPRHGTTGLDAFQLQAPDPNRGSAGITVHDTKGQQFFTQEEERFAEQMLQGKVKEGSAVDSQNFKYWFMLGSFGFFSTASLAAAPHVVVLVFDVTLRSFQQMLRERAANELCMCYRKIVRRAAKQGHEVFAVLTHIDAYAPDGDSDEDEQSEEHSGESSGENSAGKPSAGGASGFDRDVDMPGIISLWREQVSQVLGADEKAPLPKDNVFAVQNYHQESSAQDPVLDLASLECLESVIMAGQRYVDERYQQQQEGCVIA
eukprot:jgi/Undpi1/9790/HiC_scaffold_27.g12245.m1